MLKFTKRGPNNKSKNNFNSAGSVEAFDFVDKRAFNA